jgi:hypothetical protein
MHIKCMTTGRRNCNTTLASVAEMVGLGGLEPPTSPLSGVRSNHLSYRPNGLTRSV